VASIQLHPSSQADEETTSQNHLHKGKKAQSKAQMKMFKSWKETKVRRIHVDLDRIIYDFMKKKKIKKYAKATKKLAEELQNVFG